MTETFAAEDADAIMRRVFGVGAEEFDKLSIEQRAQLAYDRGLAFAGNVAVTTEDGGQVTERAEAKVAYVDFTAQRGTGSTK